MSSSSVPSTSGDGGPTTTRASPSPTPAPPSPPHPPREPTPAVADTAVDPDAQSPSQVIIDMDTFDQILDLDEDETHEFSKGMAWAYFTQVSQTFDEMDAAYAKKDLTKLSSLGHFLKGSSAALGVSRVQASCEQIQHYGELRDEQAHRDLSPAEALEKIQVTLTRVKKEYAAAEKWLKDYYARFETNV